MPRAGERDEQLAQPEVHVPVEEDAEHVHAEEYEGQAAEVAVQVEEPGRAGPLPEDAAGEREAPQHRRGEQRPAEQAAGAGHVPPELVHAVNPVDVCGAGAPSVKDHKARLVSTAPSSSTRRPPTSAR